MAEFIIIFDSATGRMIYRQGKSADLSDAQVISGKVASGAIGGAHLANAAVLSANIASGQISTQHLASGTIGSGIITPGSVMSASVAANSLATPHFLNQGILSASVGAGVLATPHFQNAGVLSASIGSGQMGPHIAAAGVLSAHVASGSLGPQIAAAGVLSAHIGANILATPHFLNQGILSASVGAGVLATPHFWDGGILSASIASGQIGPQIAAAGVLSAQIASGSLGPHIAAAGVLSAHIGTNVLATPHFANQGILSASIALQAVGLPHLVRGATSGQALLAQGAADLAFGAAGASVFTDLTDVKFVRKTADEIFSGTGTLQNDSHLLFPIAANAVWVVQAGVWYRADDTRNFQCQFAVPAGAFGHMSYIGHPGTGSDIAGDTMISGTVVLNLKGNVGGFTNPNMATLFAVIRNAGTAGNVQFQWSASTSSPVGVGVNMDSYLLAHKLA